MAYEIGQRVGAVCGADGDDKLEIYGFGVYEGDKVPDVEVIEDSPSMACMLKAIGVENPCILLDNGERVYGCECWWGPEQWLQNLIEDAKAKGREIVEVSIIEKRKPTQEELEQQSNN